MSDIKPLGDRLLIKPIEREEMTSSGLVLPDTAKEKPMEGEAVAAGPGARNDKGERAELDVKVGDTVLFAKYAGTEFKSDGVDYLIIAERDVLAVVG